MAALMGGAPALNETKLDQIAALPLGSRVVVSGWDGSATFPHRKATPLMNPSEKMPFQVTPVFPYLMRYEDINSTKVAARQPD
jgi:hypothetical protein